MAPRTPPSRPPDPTVVRRKRSGVEQVRKTIYLLPLTSERLERFAFEGRRKEWEVVEEALREYLDRYAPVPSRRRTTRPPTSQPPPTTRKTTIPPRSGRA